jgi:hypothetical protein
MPPPARDARRAGGSSSSGGSSSKVVQHSISMAAGEVVGSTRLGVAAPVGEEEGPVAVRLQPQPKAPKQAAQPAQHQRQQQHARQPQRRLELRADLQVLKGDLAGGEGQGGAALRLH